MQPALDEDGDAAGHGHGLNLVVGDVDEGGLQPTPQFDELETRLGSQLGVQVGKRLVHEEHAWTTHNGARQRNPLALPSREGSRLAVQIVTKVERGRGFDHPRPALGGVEPTGCATVHRDMPAQEWRFDVLEDGHVRIERVALEDHGDVAVSRIDSVHHLLADAHRSAGRLVEPRDHAQRRRLATAGGAQQHEQLAVFDVECQVIDRNDVTEAFRDLAE